MKFVKELRLSSGGSLSFMALQDVVSGVTQMILDHEVKDMLWTHTAVTDGFESFC